MSKQVVTKTDRKMEDAMLAAAGDTERVDAISKARAFKRTWLELADCITKIHDRESWKRWGFDSFEAYCRKELHIKKGTVAKLLGSFRFLESSVPTVIERARDAQSPVPSLQVVDFVARATERGAADAQTMQEIHKAAFDEGAEAPLLSRRFKEVAFPVDNQQRSNQLRSQLASAARRLANLIAEPDAPVEHDVATKLEEALGLLLDTLEASG